MATPSCRRRRRSADERVQVGRRQARTLVSVGEATCPDVQAARHRPADTRGLDRRGSDAVAASKPAVRRCALQARTCGHRRRMLALPGRVRLHGAGPEACLRSQEGQHRSAKDAARGLLIRIPSHACSAGRMRPSLGVREGRAAARCRLPRTMARTAGRPGALRGLQAGHRPQEHAAQAAGLHAVIRVARRFRRRNRSIGASRPAA